MGKKHIDYGPNPLSFLRSGTARGLPRHSEGRRARVGHDSGVDEERVVAEGRRGPGSGPGVVAVGARGPGEWPRGHGKLQAGGGVGGGMSDGGEGGRTTMGREINDGELHTRGGHKYSRWIICVKERGWFVYDGGKGGAGYDYPTQPLQNHHLEPSM